MTGPLTTLLLLAFAHSWAPSFGTDLSPCPLDSHSAFFLPCLPQCGRLSHRSTTCTLPLTHLILLSLCLQLPNHLSLTLRLYRCYTRYDRINRLISRLLRSCELETCRAAVTSSTLAEFGGRRRAPPPLRRVNNPFLLSIFFRRSVYRTSISICRISLS